MSKSSVSKARVRYEIVCQVIKKVLLQRMSSDTTDGRSVTTWSSGNLYKTNNPRYSRVRRMQVSSEWSIWEWKRMASEGSLAWRDKMRRVQMQGNCGTKVTRIIKREEFSSIEYNSCTGLANLFLKIFLLEDKTKNFYNIFDRFRQSKFLLSNSAYTKKIATRILIFFINVIKKMNFLLK